jgi:hypothetical protein
MFKEYVRKNYRQCCTKEDFFNIRRDLQNYENYENYGKEAFQEELNSLSIKPNALANIVLGKSREKYVDYGKFILSVDRYDSNHYLLIPKDLKYLNALTLKFEDIHMLDEMKKLIYKYLGNNYLMFFHCYPFNSIHTLHLHVIREDLYIDKKNNLKIDDVIYILENENLIILGIMDTYEKILSEWFDNNKLTMLHIYIASLICIEHSKITKDKTKYIPMSLEIVLNYLVKNQKIDNKQTILDYLESEKDTMEPIREILFTIAKNNYLLQKRF